MVLDNNHSVYVSDMNECKEKGMCPNGQCINMDGSYKCRCNRGYKQSPNQQICLGNVLTWFNLFEEAYGLV